MAPESISEKAPRAYRSELRQRQAELTRARVVEAAAELFATDGYTRTTLAKIASTAGVSVETVQGLGPKAALMIAAIEHAAFGVIGAENVMDLPAGRSLTEVDSPEQAADFMVATQADVHQRTAQLVMALVAGAGTEPELDRFFTDLLASVRRQFRRVLEVYGERGWIRSDVDFEEVLETAVVIGSDETYLRMVHRGGWSDDAYKLWCRRILLETVFVSAQQI